MKNKYVSPDVEVVSAEALEALTISVGDVDVNVEEGFF